MLAGITGVVTAVFAGLITLRKRSGELAAAEELELLELRDWRRQALRVISRLRDLLAEHDVAEPEGLDDELRYGRSRRSDRAGRPES